MQTNVQVAKYENVWTFLGLENSVSRLLELIISNFSTNALHKVETKTSGSRFACGGVRWVVRLKIARVRLSFLIL